MNDAEPLNESEYRWLMRWQREGMTGDSALDSRASALAQRHELTIVGTGDERTAIHEAGHAIVGHALGFDTVYIQLGSDANGETQRSKPDQDAAHEQVVDMLHHVAIECAGYVAEEVAWGVARQFEWKAFGRVAARWVEGADSVNQLSVDERKALLPKPEEPHVFGMVHALIDQGEKNARAILEKNWDRTAALADELRSQPRLEGDTLASFLAEVKAEHEYSAGA